ncbi:MAG: aquaporin family protein [Verrucomicrobia bacterium]|nr:aquaporin family protein [Verrucomicrobiota bacterium]
MNNYMAEFMGTSILILMGNGAVANVNLNRSGMKDSGTLMILLGWGLAVMIPAYIFGDRSGAHFNPALTIGLALCGDFPWIGVPGYILAQFLGAFFGQWLLYQVYKDHFNATSDPATIFKCFATSPSIRNLPRNFLQELVATFILVYSILGISEVKDLAGGVNYIYIFGIICSIGMSMGGLTGFAINPARDIGPRLVHTLLRIPNKGSSNWSYAFVPGIAPIVGAALAAGVHYFI